MKRILLSLGTLTLLFQFVGCGGNSPPPADGSNKPSEVQEYEKRKQEEFDRKTNAPK